MGLSSEESLPPDNDTAQWEIRDQAFFDAQLEPQADRTADTWLEVALIRNRQHPAEHYCRVRTPLLLAKRGAGNRQSLLVVRQIAAVQQRWAKELGAQFFTCGRVRRRLFRLQSSASVRAYGTISRIERAEVALPSVYAALEVIAYAWDLFRDDPERAGVLAHGLHRLVTGLADAVRAREELLRRRDELHRKHPLLDSEWAHIQNAIDRGSPHLLREYWKKHLHIREFPSDIAAHGRSPDANTTVLHLIHHAFGDAMHQFAPESSHQGDYRPVLTLDLVAAVGKALGRARNAPPSASAPTRRHGEPDSRLFRLTADLLAQQFHEPADTLLRDLVRPALKHDAFVGLLYDADNRNQRRATAPSRNTAKPRAPHRRKHAARR